MSGGGHYSLGGDIIHGGQYSLRHRYSKSKMFSPDSIPTAYLVPLHSTSVESMNCLLVMKIKWSLDINTGAVERSEAARARSLAGATVGVPNILAYLVWGCQIP